jgi:anti-sigma-K factor RskA
MRYRDKPELIDRLAAEFVLGTLSGGARRRFQAWMEADAAVRLAVSEWEARLNPMAEAVAPVTPAPKVWQAVQRNLGPEPRAETGGGLWQNLAFWRGFGLAASAVAAGLVVYVGVRPPQVVERERVVERVVERPMRVSDGANPWQPSYVATLKDKSGKTMLMLYVGRNSDEVWMKYEGDAMPQGASLELWGLDAQGKPKSLGLIRNTGAMQMKLPDRAERMVAQYKTLAVSMEPPGGSPSGSPTGPVMYQGECQTFW